MEYPRELYRNGRPKLPASDIESSHRMYMRHLPGYDWNMDEGLPDYTKIKIDPENRNNQSYNWNKFSKPHWARFNPDCEYLPEYAVVSYLVDTIRRPDQYDNSIPANMIDIEHKPIEINYSHCELLCKEVFDKLRTAEIRKIKRPVRLAFKNKAEIELLPQANT